MINSSVEDLKKIKKKSIIIHKAYSLLADNKKPMLDKVRKLCEQIEELEMGDEGYSTIKTIMSMMQEYIEWDREQFDRAGKKGP